MVAPLSEVPQEGSSVFSLFSLIKLHLASHPLASSYSRMTVSSVFCAQNIFFRPRCVGPVNRAIINSRAMGSTLYYDTVTGEKHSLIEALELDTAAMISC